MYICELRLQHLSLLQEILRNLYCIILINIIDINRSHIVNVPLVHAMKIAHTYGYCLTNTHFFLVFLGVLLQMAHLARLTRSRLRKLTSERFIGCSKKDGQMRADEKEHVS